MDERLLRQWLRETVITEAGLTFTEIDKYGPRRYKTFLKKMQEKSPFVIDGPDQPKYAGGPVIIPVEGNESLVSALQAEDIDAYKAAFKQGVNVTLSDGTPKVMKASGHLSKQGFGGTGPRGTPASIQNELDFAQFIDDQASKDDPISINIGGYIIDGITAASQSGSDKIAQADGSLETSKADVNLVQCDAATNSCQQISLKLDTAEYWLSGDAVLANDFGPIVKRLLDTPPPGARIEKTPEGKYVMMQGDSQIVRLWFEIPTALQQKAVFGEGNNVAQIVAKGNFMKRPTWNDEDKTLTWAGGSVYTSLADIPSSGTPVGAFRTGESGRGMTYDGVKYSGIRPVIITRGFAEKGNSAQIQMNESIDVGSCITDAERTMLAERLLLEAIPKSDKKEIEKIVLKVINNPFTGKRTLEQQTQKLIDDSIKKALGVSFFGFRGKINDFVIKSIQEEVAKWIADKKTKQQIAEITKSILKKFYREISLGYSPVIDRLKVS